MNTNSFGPEAWGFVHQWTQTFPNEILSTKEASAAIRLCCAFLRILPCKYCRKSAEGFKQELGFWKSLTWQHPVTGRYFVTRTKLANFFVAFHNKVNRKLGYPICVHNSVDAWLSFRVHNALFKLNNEKDWVARMFNFLFAVCWNYEFDDPSPEKTDKYHEFFAVILPAALAHLPALSRAWTDAVAEYRFSRSETLLSRAFLTQWIFHVREYCNDLCSDTPFTWTFNDADILMEAFRARSAQCTVETKPIAPDDPKISCQ